MPFFQDVDAKLTLTRVASAPTLIAEIAKATGQKLEVSPVLSTEILMVSVENARPGDVLAKLAVAATARWEPIEGGYRLVPDGAARSIEASSERARRLFAMTEGLKKRQAAAKDKGEGDDMAAAMGGMFGGGNGVDAFVPLLDLNLLANMRSGDRIVFASSANGAQRALRGNPVPLVQTWIAGHNKAAKTMSGSMDQMPDPMSGIMNGPIGDRIRRMSRPVTAAPTKVLVVATRGGNPLMGIMGVGSDVRLDVRAYGADGAVLLEQSGSLGTDMMAMFAEMAAKQKAPAAPAPASSVAIKYSDDAKALMAMNGGGNPMMSGGFSRGTKLSPSLHERLFNPRQFEPLALIPGEGLVALAKARRKPLVACLPDDAYPGLIGNAAPKTVDDVEESLKSGSMRLVPDAAFLVVKAAEPETARQTRVDRGALTQLMGDVADHEVPALGELAAFAAASPPPTENRMEMALVGTFVPASMGSMSGMVSWDALRLFAALSPAQRDSLANGAKLPFGTLSPGAQNSLRSLLYGAGDNLTVERAGAAPSDIFSMSMRMMMGGSAVDAREEPTEVAPRGLPADGFLQASVSTETIIRPIAADGPTYYALGTDELAMVRLISSSGLPGGADEAMKLPEGGRLGTRTLWNLRGYVASGAYVGSALSDDRTPKNGQTVSLNALPADLQASVAQKAERLKKSPLGTILSMGAAFGKPPVQP